MAKQNQGRRRTAPPQISGVPVTPEPPVRRWPHPVEGTDPAAPAEPSLHYIRCALSYQNQLLADIKALLEELAEGQAERREEKET